MDFTQYEEWLDEELGYDDLCCNSEQALKQMGEQEDEKD